MSGTELTAADLVVESLVAARVPCVFGVTGTTILDILDSMYERDDIRYYGVRHEAVAACMADAYARVTGRVGVCTCHVGPAAAQLLYGIANAHKDSSPVIALTGNENASVLGRDVYHELDVVSLFAPITKWSVQVKTSAEIPRIMRTAIIRATTGRPGPVHVSLPKDILKEKVEGGRGTELGFVTEMAVRVPLLRVGPSPELVDRAVELITQSQRPIIVAGGGLIWSDASEELAKLAELIGSPVATTETGRGSIPDDHPNSLGPVGWDSLASITANKALEEADLVLGLGWTFSDSTTRNWTLIDPKARIIQVDIDPSEIGRQYPIDLGVVSDAKTFLTELIGKLTASEVVTRSDESRVEGLRREAAEERARFFIPSTVGGSGIKPQLVVQQVGEIVERDAFIAVDTGLHLYYASRIPIYLPRTYLRTGGLGAMGFALAAAMAAKIAFPNRQAVAMMGDGCFAMVMQELETAVRYNLPMVTIIFNNFSFGSQKLQQRQRYGERYIGSDHGNPDYGMVARLFGAEGERIERIEDFAPALKRMLAAGKPGVLDVIIDCEETPDRWMAQWAAKR